MAMLVAIRLGRTLRKKNFSLALSYRVQNDARRNARRADAMMLEVLEVLMNK
jgi:hypothetical protein